MNNDPHHHSHVLIRQKLIDASEGRLDTVTEEFEKAFDILQKFEKTVTIFGSARLLPDHPAYQNAYKTASTLAKQGYAIVTGGGNGIMEAANKGALEAGGASVGFNIQLPTEQNLNKFTTDNYSFEHFFGRKVALTLQANAFVYFAGGFGTMDELFEIVTLEQTGKIPRVPIILFGSDYWRPILDTINNVFNKDFHTIDPEDIQLLKVSDDIDEVVEIINSHIEDIHKQPVGRRGGSKETT